MLFFPAFLSPPRPAGRTRGGHTQQSIDYAYYFFYYYLVAFVHHRASTTKKNIFLKIKAVKQ